MTNSVIKAHSVIIPYRYNGNSPHTQRNGMAMRCAQKKGVKEVLHIFCSCKVNVNSQIMLDYKLKEATKEKDAWQRIRRKMSM